MRGLAVLLVLLLLAEPAAAHRLRVFATVEADVVDGYAFFVGGGRPAGVEVRFERDGRVLHRTRTDDAGAFRWRPAEPGPVTIVVDAGSGHIGATTVGAPAAPAAELTAGDPLPALAPEIEAAIEAAIARQIRPLREDLAAAESQMRLTDVAGGLGMILGIVGTALWLAARRERHRGH